MYQFIPKINTTVDKQVINSQVINSQVINSQVINSQVDKQVINNDDFPPLVNEKTVIQKPVWGKPNSQINKNILEKLKEPFSDKVAKVAKSKNINTYKKREKRKDIYDSNSEEDGDDNNEDYYDSSVYNGDINTKYLDSDSEEFV